MLRDGGQRRNYVTKCVWEDREPWDSSVNGSFISWRYFQPVTHTLSNRTFGYKVARESNLFVLASLSSGGEISGGAGETGSCAHSESLERSQRETTFPSTQIQSQTTQSCCHSAESCESTPVQHIQAKAFLYSENICGYYNAWCVRFCGSWSAVKHNKALWHRRKESKDWLTAGGRSLGDRQKSTSLCILWVITSTFKTPNIHVSYCFYNPCCVI